MKYKYECGKCNMFACPVFMKDPKTIGCDYGPDVLNQIKKSKRGNSRDFEEVCKELGI
jgi:hypothetical protein